MATLEYPYVNGDLYDYSCIKFRLNKKTYTAVKSINFKDTVNGAWLRGTAQIALGQTPGEYECEASMELGLQECFDIIDDLGDGYMNVRFDVEVQFSVGDKTYQVDIVGCKGKGFGNAHSAGPDALTVTVDLSPHYIKRNGKMPVKLPGAQT